MEKRRNKKIIIMGAGPAGLACGYELSNREIEVSVLEKDDMVGGISRTINYKGYYFDVGGHRFFTKYSEVEKLWHLILGERFLRVSRLSRIYYRNKFFYYPLRPLNALLGVGFLDTFLIILSYIKSKLFPYKEEKTIEEWVSNRFGKRLYNIFFKTYTEKVWGIPCSQIGSEWSAQRIKGLSLSSAIRNALIKPKSKKIKTLIQEFEYPVLGPGMMYNTFKENIEKSNSKVLLNSEVISINHKNGRINSVTVKNKRNNEVYKIEGSDFVSSIPISTLIKRVNPQPPELVLKAADKLRYRGLLVVNVIINKRSLFPDNWIYIHSPDVRLGRIQNPKNWSRYMVSDLNKTTLGLEYFCFKTDDLWNLPDNEMIAFAVDELEKIKIAKAEDVEDGFVFRMPNAYPVYEIGYKEYLDVIKRYLSQFENLQVIGRCGMYKYNNMDHSIITGLLAARNILGEKHDIWRVNEGEEYLEIKKEY